MKINDLLREKDFSISFEVFPPKKEKDLSKIYESIKELASLKPDFISVTYGAAGSTTKNTVEIARLITNEFDINTLAHLTCIDSTKEDILNIISSLKAVKIENVLALRGDIPRDSKENFKKDFNYASDLISFLRESSNFSIGAACYPEGHTESVRPNDDIKNLKSKVNTGADFLISQMFFDNNYIYNLIDKLDLIDINIPIIAGIMPITNKNQIEKIASLSGAKIPRKLQRILDKYKDNDTILQEAGIIYATEQILDLIASDKIHGIHIYTMNKPYIAKKIMDNIRPLI